ncbi:TPA: fimbria/pilus periplasmic chaperone [Enterobacter cloacae]
MTIVRISALTGLALMVSGVATAAISLDRTRVIFDGAAKSVSLRLTNENKTLPYLAQGWVEDAQGKKITDPLVLLPPVQRIEPGEQSQIKVQSTAGIQRLPQNRESLFYFNLREIPPKSSKPNTLQLALQTRIKLFYRPAAIEVQRADYSTPFQEQLTLTRIGDKYRVNNPTPYYISLVNASSTLTGKAAAGFKPIMVEPKGQLVLTPSAAALGSAPVLTYVNDFGGRAKLIFSCGGNECKAVPQEKKK